MSEGYEFPDFEDAERPEDLRERLVRDKVRTLRVDREARAILAREGRDTEPFDAGTLAEVLARPDEPRARVESLIPWQASTLVVAQRKTGKTTLTLNLARCLLTGEPFLGSLAVRPIGTAARVALLNFEVSGGQLARWARDAGVPLDRLFLVNLRGRRNPLSDPADRAELARLLRAQRVESLIVDPFGRAYSGASQNDAGEVGAWLVALDTFARAEAKALDVILTAHAGWNGERSRGSSALEDWADSIVTLTRDEESGDRFIRATGRDVDMDEDRLDFDAETRTLSLSGSGSRKTSAASRHLSELAAAVVVIVAEHGPVNGSGVAEHLRADDVPHQKGDHSKALKLAVEDGRLSFTLGSRGAKVYTVSTDLPRHTPTYPSGVPATYPDPPYRGGVGQGVAEGSTYPKLELGQLPDRCPSCEWHTPTQGHADTCQMGATS